MTTLEFIDPRLEYVTDFTLKGERLGLRSFDWRDESGWLYAFATMAGIRYVGQTSRILRSRLSDYRHNTTSQPRRIRTLIIAELKAGGAVSVIGMKQSDPALLVSGEAELLARHRPPWNRSIPA